MLLRKKTLVLFICFFMIAFKAAAGSIFIQAAIERAELAYSYANGSIVMQVQNIAESVDDKEPVHTMYLMSHVTANITEIGITVLHRFQLIRFLLQMKFCFRKTSPTQPLSHPKLQPNLLGRDVL
jgi:hypothetical protein